MLHHNVLFARYIKQYNVGAIHKSLPDWVWLLNPAHAKILLDGMMLGNGTKHYDTSSKQLADDVQRLALHAGFSANLCRAVDSYRLTIIEKQNRTMVNKNIKPDGSGRSDSYTDYTGKV
jgi:hypothetical protein